MTVNAGTISDAFAFVKGYYNNDVEGVTALWAGMTDAERFELCMSLAAGLEITSVLFNFDLTAHLDRILEFARLRYDRPQ